MKFKKYEFLSKAGASYNEDAAFATDSYGWVIDGATGLSDKNLIDTVSDAKWFVEEWDRYLKSNIRNESQDLKSIVANGVNEIKNKYIVLSGLPLDKINKLDLPSASISIVRLINDRVEYFCLGDCTILFEKGRVIKSISDNKLRVLDNKVIQYMRNEMSMGIGFGEARQKAQSILVEHRLLRNTEDGYWSLEFDKNAVDNARYGFIEGLGIINMLLMTDGFSAIHDAYDALNPDELLWTVEQNGLEVVYDMVREIENEDDDCTKYVRFKKSDDASAVYFLI